MNHTNYKSPAICRNPQGFGLGIVGNDGQPLPLYRDHNGGLWCASRVGQEYGLEIIVPDSGRYGVLTTVDGLDTQDGSPATGTPATEPMWVINQPSGPGKNIIPGWTRPGQKVAAFTFAETPESYAAQMGKGEQNCGVVAARFFFEAAARPAFATRGLGGHGTAYGREKDFQVGTTDFTVDGTRNPITIVVRYAPESQLVAAGFTAVRDLPDAAAASPFPGAAPQRPTCPPPPGWRK